MATVTKDFRIKSGLVVEGTNGTINGSDIITEDAITGGTQTNIAVTYDPQSKTVSFVAENGIADSTTDDLAEGENNLYFTEQRAIDAVGGSATPDNTPNTVVKRDEDGNFAAENVTVEKLKASNGDTIFNSDSSLGGPELTIGSGPSSTTIRSTSLNTGGVSISSSGINLPSGGAGITAGGSLNIPVYDGLDGAHIGKFRANAIGDYNYDVIGKDMAGKPELRSEIYKTTVAGVEKTVISNNFMGLSGVTVDADTVSASVIGKYQAGMLNSTVYLGNNMSMDNLIATQGNISTALTTAEEYVDDHSDLTTGVHGVAGDVVGTTDAQTLSNKTLGNDLDAGGFRVVDLAAPDQPTDAATKGYVDSVAEGLHVHASAVAATTANIDLSTGGLLEIDGVQLVEDNRVLVKNQNTASQNGIYLAKPSAWVRAADFDSPAEVDGGDFIFVTGGNTYADTGWVQTTDAVTTIGSDPIVFTQFSGAGTYLPGYGLNLDGNTFEVDATEIASQTDLNNAVTDLTDAIEGYLDPSTGTTVQYIDDQDAATLLAANGYSDALVAAGDATATPTYLALDINDVAKQVASSVGPVDEEVIAYMFAKADYRSAKFLVKVAYGSHTEMSEVLLTLDTSDNVAITEYAVVGTNGSASTISATVVDSNVQLMVNPTNASSTVNVYGTLLA